MISPDSTEMEVNLIWCLNPPELFSVSVVSHNHEEDEFHLSGSGWDVSRVVNLDRLTAHMATVDLLRLAKFKLL